jgi:serine/threonine-protein kinase
MSTPTLPSVEIPVIFDTTPSASPTADPGWATTLALDAGEGESAVEAFLVRKVGAARERSRVEREEREEREASESQRGALVPVAGHVIAGKYRLEAHLASGGMGSVWTAHHIDLDIPIAIKLMAMRCGRASRNRARFLREARAAAKLRSRNVVAVLDYGVDRDTPYIAMERLDGEDLWTRLARRRTLPAPEIAKLLAAIGGALELARAAGIVHRDLKPENIFFARVAGEPEEVVKVLDFGLAKELFPSPGEESTTTGVVVGTPHYMSPEQATGAQLIDHRSDLWSIGVILYQALTGHLPFTGAFSMDVLNAIVSAPIRPPSSVAPGLSADVDRFFARALERDPNARFQAVREMINAFERLIPGASPTLARGSLEDTLVEIASGDFIATADEQLDTWTCGVPAQPTHPARTAP